MEKRFPLRKISIGSDRTADPVRSHAYFPKWKPALLLFYQVVVWETGKS